MHKQCATNATLAHLDGSAKVTGLRFAANCCLVRLKVMCLHVRFICLVRKLCMQFERKFVVAAIGKESPWSDVLPCGAPKPVADAIYMSAMWQTVAMSQCVDLILHLRKDLLQTRQDMRTQGQHIAKLQNELQLQTAVIAQILRTDHLSATGSHS